MLVLCYSKKNEYIYRTNDSDLLKNRWLKLKVNKEKRMCKLWSQRFKNPNLKAFNIRMLEFHISL